MVLWKPVRSGDWQMQNIRPLCKKGRSPSSKGKTRNCKEMLQSSKGMFYNCKGKLQTSKGKTRNCKGKLQTSKGKTRNCKGNLKNYKGMLYNCKGIGRQQVRKPPETLEKCIGQE
jgi:hypothetical protein